MHVRAAEITDDLSALAWVHEELRKSLDAAHKALRRYQREAEALQSDVDALDPGVLRVARQHLHQSAGALELVGQPAAAMLLRASEAAVARLGQRRKPITLSQIETLERGSFALLDYMSRTIARKPVSSLALFPAYRSLQEMAGAERVHPADLWVHDWRWRDLPPETGVTPLTADAQALGLLETELLALMRQSPRAAENMSELFAGLAAGSGDQQLATMWRLASAFFQAQAHGLMLQDVYSKRVASRLLAQMRSYEQGTTGVSERLAQDILFFCAQAGQAGDDEFFTPRLAAVRSAYDLRQAQAIDYEDGRLGRFDPAWIAQARKRVAGAKDAWSAVAGGELHRMVGLSEQFSLVGDSLGRLYPDGDRLASVMQEAVQETVAAGAAPSPELAMEIATAVLYLDASLEDAEFDNPDEAGRVRRLAQRIDQVRRGAVPEPLEAWMEELYRHVSDRQTMGNVVQELRSSLSESEKLIDRYFRDPTNSDVLIPVAGQLQAMRGVLSVLGLEHASHAVLRMRDDVAALAGKVYSQHSAPAGTFDRLAANLGALGFLIDMLCVQPQLVKSLFEFDTQTGTLRSALRSSSRGASPAEVVEEPEELVQVPVPAEAVASTAIDEPADTSEFIDTLFDGLQRDSSPVLASPAPAPVDSPAPVIPAPAMPAVEHRPTDALQEEEDDDEMREV
ncbi:MAG TPA: hybrid sensor histidine kinase/response regulator, partial [Burkholderiaceae bacterium]|nr:hybrid sensor histidine kinase/response regulator [Burkholderiaceae bacterium]